MVDNAGELDPQWVSGREVVGVTAGASAPEVLVKQVIMPPLSLMTEGVKFADKSWVLREGTFAADGTPIISEVTVAYGALIEVLLDFLIIGFTVFVVVKLMNRFRKKAEDPADKTVAPARDVQLLESLNHLMQEQNELLRKK